MAALLGIMPPAQPAAATAAGPVDSIVAEQVVGTRTDSVGTEGSSLAAVGAGLIAAAGVVAIGKRHTPGAGHSATLDWLPLK